LHCFRQVKKARGSLHEPPNALLVAKFHQGGGFRPSSPRLIGHRRFILEASSRNPAHYSRVRDVPCHSRWPDWDALTSLKEILRTA
jgi:hypothetical protein